MLRFFKALFIVTFVLSLLVGCQQNEETSTVENDSGISDETKTTYSYVRIGDFIYRLSTEKEQYNGEEPIMINAELEYVGDQAQIDITHAASTFYFPIKETTRNYDIPYAMEQPLLHTTLVKGEPLKMTYHGSGGYSEQDKEEVVHFMKQIMAGDFPTGSYVVEGYVEFTVVETKEPMTIKGTVHFDVQ